MARHMEVIRFILGVSLEQPSLETVPTTKKFTDLGRKWPNGDVNTRPVLARPNPKFARLQRPDNDLPDAAPCCTPNKAVSEINVGLTEIRADIQL